MLGPRNTYDSCFISCVCIVNCCVTVVPFTKPENYFIRPTNNFIMLGDTYFRPRNYRLLP